MVGIIVAMEVEIDLIKNSLEEKETKEINGMSFIKGKIGKTSVVCAVCGMGKVNAAICAQTMILVFKPDCIINTGVAGGLSNKLNICDIAVADKLIEHDIDITPLGYPLGYIGGEDTVATYPDSELLGKLLEKARKLPDINVISGTIVSGDQFIHTKEKKEFLKSEFGAVACEMEGAAIAHVCFTNKVKFSVIRAISDGAKDDAPMDFNEFCKKAAKNSANILINYLLDK